MTEMLAATFLRYFQLMELNFYKRHASGADSRHALVANTFRILDSGSRLQLRF